MQDLTYLESLVDALIPKAALSMLPKLNEISQFRDVFEALNKHAYIWSALEGISGPTRSITVYQLAKLLWMTLPMPLNDLKPGQWIPPTPFKRCVCLSGKRESTCCDRISVDPNFNSEDLITHIADKISSEVLNDWSKLNPPAWLRVIIAQRWLDENRFKKALKLITPLHKELANLPPHIAVEVVDQSMQSYECLGYHKKRQSFIEQQLQSASPQLRSNIIQQQSLVAASRGMHNSANSLLHLARLETPNHLDLIPLELLILVSRGAHDTLRQRAIFWHSWCRRNLAPTHPMLLFLKDIIRFPTDVSCFIHPTNSEWSPQVNQILDNARAALQLNGQYCKEIAKIDRSFGEKLLTSENDEV